MKKSSYHHTPPQDNLGRWFYDWTKGTKGSRVRQAEELNRRLAKIRLDRALLNCAQHKKAAMVAARAIASKSCE